MHESSTTLWPKQGAVLVIENVGNLVCPSLFDLGEAKRVVIISSATNSQGMEEWYEWISQLPANH